MRPLVISLVGAQSGNEVLAATAAVETCGLKMPEAIVEVAVERDMANAFAAADWKSYAIKSKDVVHGDSFQLGCWSLPHSSQVAFCKKALFKSIADVLRPQENLQARILT